MTVTWADLSQSQRRTLIALDHRYGSTPDELSARQAEDARVLERFGLVDIAERCLTDFGRSVVDDGVGPAPVESEATAH
ncbi:hypothetical protein [Aureimonas leprariae]|uniref:Uncharacterized protein n=1 Tax=Plantimonas leprariae TaxID=2615207 RepID=A0A7V7PQ28_9HYPH|nr:hypothetical protein [Aureimonas leprariae]KAB0680171.1 hypothetical protein F6X38_08250 [Aureimonas leprariae]